MSEGVILGRLNWRNDCYGDPDMALYIGGLNIGHILLSHQPRDTGQWRAWLMTDEDGESIGWFETKEEAKVALVAAATKALFT